VDSLYNILYIYSLYCAAEISDAQILMPSIYLLLNFRNLPRAISKLSVTNNVLVFSIYIN
jgi:hypothetical protein